MPWKLVVDSKAVKKLSRLPQKDSARLFAALEQMSINPYSGDIAKMKGDEDVWRRRIGSYRVFYEVISKEALVYVYDVRRRTSTTYS